jgi:hypothetical protein
VTRAWLRALAGALLVAAEAGAETRRVEAAGAAPLEGREAAAVESLRSAAVKDALGDAALRVARELVPDVEPGSEREAALARSLGADPTVYAVRFRILEDRGKQAVPLLPDAAPGPAYVVRVEAVLEVDRVRSRLREAGLLAAAAPPAPADTRLLVVLEGIPSYPAYAALRGALSGDLARSAVPERFEPGRAALRVETDRSAAQLMEGLRAAAPPGLALVQLPSEPGTLRVRVGGAPQ